MKNTQKAVATGSDIPFSRMVVISFKWVFAVIPAILVAFLGSVLLHMLWSYITAGVMVTVPKVVGL